MNQHNFTIDTDAIVPIVEGQASVEKRDPLTLLDDSNSYWWLVKVLRSEEIESKIVIKKQNQLEVDANNNNIIIQIQNQAYDGLNFDEDMDRDNGVVYTNLELKNEDVLMTEKKEFKIEDKNFSNSPIENTVNPSTLNNNFVSIDNKTSITSDSSKMQTENNFNNLNINKQVTIDQLISPPLSPEPTRLNSIPNINQQMEQKYNQHFDSNNQPQMAPESTGIISPTNQIELNNNNIQPPNSNTFVLPLPDEPNQNIKASITPALAKIYNSYTTDFNNAMNHMSKSTNNITPNYIPPTINQSQYQIQQQKQQRVQVNPQQGFQISQQQHQQLFQQPDIYPQGQQNNYMSLGDSQRPFLNIQTQHQQQQSTCSNDNNLPLPPKQQQSQSLSSAQPMQNSKYENSSVQQLLPSSPPTYSILRIFSGQNLKFNFAFKIVLINQMTTTTDLIKQALNRFKIDNENNWDDYFITIKKTNGEESHLMPHDHPLEIFQSLNSYSTAPLPSIKRSSIASVSSTSSNISNHPKIKNLESNYNENPVTVAFYLNKKISRNSRSSIGDKKLHLRVITYADDLPTHLRSKGPLAPIPRISLSVTKHLADKTARRRSREEGKPREKHLIVNGLTTVADVILKSMKKFGIVDGIVDDGEHIESNDDEIPRYRLMLNIEGNEKLLNPKAGILSEYPTPPNLRHLSIDSLDSASSHALDYLPDEPIFVLRLLKPEDRINRAMPDAIDPKKYMQQSSSSSLEKQMINYNESMNENSDNNDELLKRKQLIEKQREYSRAKQKSIISAHKNTEQGIDIVISDGAIRSSRIFGGSKVRYSFISADGEEIDISDIVEDIMGDDYELVVEEGIDEDPIKEQHQKHQEDSNLTPIDFSNNSSNEESLSSPAPNKKKSYRRSSTQDVDILVKIIGRAQNSNDDERSSQSLDKIGLVIEKVKQTPSYRLSKSNLNPNSDPNFNPNFTQPNSIMSIESENQDTAGSLVYKPNSKTQPFQQTKTRDRSFSNSSVSDFGLKELLMLVRSGVNMLELRERRKSGWHLNEDPEKVLKQIKPTEIKEEIKDIFSDVNQQIDKMEQDLDKLLDDVINTF
ncbi:9621_t:CDS:2 [Entrophospora sp. SA101]|nr:9621_t:CDS:2 [Entrophospora sp. SA101]